MTHDRKDSSGDEVEKPSITRSASGRTVAGQELRSAVDTSAYRGEMSGLSRTRSGNPSREASSDSAEGSRIRKGRADSAKSSQEGDGSGAAKSPDEDDEYEYYSWPWWLTAILWLLRKSIVPIIMVAMLIGGLYVGYVILGEQSKDEVFEWSTWQHLYDLIFAES